LAIGLGEERAAVDVHGGRTRRRRREGLLRRRERIRRARAGREVVLGIQLEVVVEGEAREVVVEVDEALPRLFHEGISEEEIFGREGRGGSHVKRSTAGGGGGSFRRVENGERGHLGRGGSLPGLLAGPRLGGRLRLLRRGGPLLVAGVAADLLPPTGVAGLDDAHQVGMVALLLGLAAARGRVGDVLAVLGHDLHAGQVGEVLGGGGGGGAGRRGGAGLALRRRGRPLLGLGCRRRGGEDVPEGRRVRDGGGGIEAGGVARVVHGGRAGGRVGGGRSGGGGLVDGVVLEVLAGPLGVFAEVHDDGCPLVLHGCRTREEGIDEAVELGSAEGREELELGTEVGLEDGEALEGGGGGVDARHPGSQVDVVPEETSAEGIQNGEVWFGSLGCRRSVCFSSNWDLKEGGTNQGG